MMTVREAAATIKGFDEYAVCYSGNAYLFDPNDAFQMAAYGDFDVKSVTNVQYPTDEGKPISRVEFYIACVPTKNGVPV